MVSKKKKLICFQIIQHFFWPRRKGKLKKRKEKSFCELKIIYSYGSSSVHSRYYKNTWLIIRSQKVGELKWRPFKGMKN